MGLRFVFQTMPWDLCGAHRAQVVVATGSELAATASTALGDARPAATGKSGVCQTQVGSSPKHTVDERNPAPPKPGMMILQNGFPWSQSGAGVGVCPSTVSCCRQSRKHPLTNGFSGYPKCGPSTYFLGTPNVGRVPPNLASQSKSMLDQRHSCLNKAGFPR